MRGTRIPVQFRRQCEGYAAARAKVRDLLLRQGLDVALLQPRVGRMLTVPHRLVVLGMGSMVLRIGDARDSDDGDRRQQRMCESLHGRMVADGWTVGPPGKRADRRRTPRGVAEPGNENAQPERVG